MDKQDWEPVLQRATEDINLSLALRQACRSAVEEIERLRARVAELEWCHGK